MKKLIEAFLLAYCTVVKENEESSYVELMMDDHKCIEWNDVQYYVPENDSHYSEDDELIYEFLTTCYHV